MDSKVPQPILFKDGVLLTLDQRKLPHEEIYLKVRGLEEAHAVIKDMVVRGAPLIGFTALYGMALWAQGAKDLSLESCQKACSYLQTARPTAVNLEYELKSVLVSLESLTELFSEREKLALWFKERAEEAICKLERDNRKMAELAEKRLDLLYPSESSFRLMTLCNTGFLACGPIGTALGVVSHLHEKSRIKEVLAFETRPYLQGARLSAYELSKQEIPYRLVVEGAMASVIESEKPHAIFVGADRIANNGDTANKVGTATLSIVAKHFGIPFFVVAPTSSFDLTCQAGENIEVEQRAQDEVLEFFGQRVAPIGAQALNPSFDITKASHIHSIFCEKGEVLPVETKSLIRVMANK